MTNPRQSQVEEFWLLRGTVKGSLWWGKLYNYKEGEVASVAFDAKKVLEIEEKYGDVIGFFHTHPGMAAVPSDRDYRTMEAWVDALGKILLCCIEGEDGLRGYWFGDGAGEEGIPEECQIEEISNSLFIGTSDDLLNLQQDEFDEEGIEDGTEQIPT